MSREQTAIRPDYVTCGPHLSGWLVRLRFSTRKNAQDAHEIIARHGIAAPTVSGGEGWEELERLAMAVREASSAKEYSKAGSALVREHEAVLALIAVARGGFSALQASPSVPTVQAETAVVGTDTWTRSVEDYIAHYGSGCRDCADEDGSCPVTKMPCEPDLRRACFRHALKAINYGVQHGYLALSQQPPVSTGEQPGMSEPVAWRPMKDAPRDETDILLNHRVHGIIQGRFWPGSWTDDTPVSPREYEGDMWVMGDDLAREEVEFGPDGYENHGNVLGWSPLDHPTPTLPDDLLSLSEAATALSQSPAIEELTPARWEWEACETTQDRYDLMKRKVSAALTLAAKQGGKS